MQTASQSRLKSAHLMFNKSGLLPVITANDNYPVICNYCGFVNLADNNFCTHCGHPLKITPERMAIFNFQQFKQNEYVKSNNDTIAHARISLYVLSAIGLLGIAYFIDSISMNYLRGGVLIMISAIFFILAKWSFSKPFSAILIGFLMLVSFIAINTWAEYRRMFTTTTGLYLLMVQFVLFYFLYKGVKAAYQVDLLTEEDKL